MALGTTVLLLSPISGWIKFLVPLLCIPLLFVIYERLAKGEATFAFEQELPERARAISEMLSTRVVAFGHSHTPRRVPLSNDTYFVDTGTWAPVTDVKHHREKREKKQRLRPGLRNYLLVAFDRQAMHIELCSKLQSE
jgi:hypothetical protein